MMKRSALKKRKVAATSNDPAAARRGSNSSSSSIAAKRKTTPSVNASAAAKVTGTSRFVLLTGFDPFGDDTMNPSWEAVRKLRGERIRGHTIVVARTPTRFDACADVLERAIRKHRPRLVLCVGQAAGRAAISLERVAINVKDARIADNAGAQPIDEPVIEGAPMAYASAMPIKAMVAALRAHGIPAEVSNSAGTYVCNALAFSLAHLIAIRWTTLRGGFVHIPFVPAQVTAKPGMPSMPLDTVREALRVCVRTALARHDDVRISEGRTQ